MRAIVTADLHCHAKRLQVHNLLMQDLTDLAIIHNCPYVIMAGDLWDQKHVINSDVYNMIYANLEDAKARGVTWFLLRGNHEITVKSDPHNTMLRLFDKVAVVLNKPTIFNDREGNVIAFMPWYLHDYFIPYVHKLTTLVRRRKAKGDTRCAILVGHIGLDEGQLSASNYYRVPQRVALNHLHPDSYELVLLGDYHLRQFVDDHALYVGTPIPQTFADGPTQGVYLLQLAEGNATLSPLSLTRTYPQFYTHVIEDAQDLLTIDFTKDHHKIRIPESLREYADKYSRLTNVIVEGLKDKERELTTGRLVMGEGGLDLIAVFKQYCKLKGLKQVHYTTGVSYIQKAMEVNHGR